MPVLRLTPQADLGLMYDIEVLRYAPGTLETWGMTREVFIGHYARCHTRGFEFDGVDIGGVIFDGTEMHLDVLPAYHGRWSGLFPLALDWLFSMRTTVLARVEQTNARCLRFFDRGGWPRTASDPLFVTFTLSSKEPVVARQSHHGEIVELD